MTDSPVCVGQWLQHAQRLLTEATEAQSLLMHVCDLPRSALYAWPERALTDAQQTQLDQLLGQRLEGVPLAYLTGTREFWSMNFQVAPGVLIPRADTETLVEVALEHYASLRSQRDGRHLPVVDLGTGSGAVAIALACELSTQIFAVEFSSKALTIAAENVRQLAPSHVRLIHGSWVAPLADNSMALIVSNPPYIADDDAHLLNANLQAEPRAALVSDDRGLADLRQLSQDCVRVLQPGGWLCLEHGYDQGDDVRNLLLSAGYDHISTRPDLAGHERVTSARLPS